MIVSLAKVLIANDAMVLESCLAVRQVQYAPTSPVLNIYSREIKYATITKTFYIMFIASLYIIKI